MKKQKKNSNVFAVEGITAMIYDGMELICKSSNFNTKEEAYDSVKRIINYQKKLMGDEMTAYGMVFDAKRMLYYID